MKVQGGLIEIARAYRWHEAQLAVALLQSANIRADIFDPHSHNQNLYPVLALGGMRLMVPRDQQDEALALLASVPPPRASLSLAARTIFAVTFIWCSIFSIANVTPMMSGLYLRRAHIEASDPA